MDKSKISELRMRAEAAQEIAAELDQLESAASPGLSYNAAFTHWNTGHDVLSEQLLKDVLMAGVQVIRERKEAQLNRLLGNDPSSPEVQQEKAADA